MAGLECLVQDARNLPAVLPGQALVRHLRFESVCFIDLDGFKAVNDAGRCSDKPGDGIDADDLLAVADEAMGQAKQAAKVHAKLAVQDASPRVGGLGISHGNAALALLPFFGAVAR